MSSPEDKGANEPTWVDRPYVAIALIVLATLLQTALAGLSALAAIFLIVAVAMLLGSTGVMRTPIKYSLVVTGIVIAAATIALSALSHASNPDDSGASGAPTASESPEPTRAATAQQVRKSELLAVESHSASESIEPSDPLPDPIVGDDAEVLEVNAGEAIKTVDGARIALDVLTSSSGVMRVATGDDTCEAIVSPGEALSAYIAHGDDLVWYRAILESIDSRGEAVRVSVERHIGNRPESVSCF